MICLFLRKNIFEVTCAHGEMCLTLTCYGVPYQYHFRKFAIVCTNIPEGQILVVYFC